LSQPEPHPAVVVEALRAEIAQFRLLANSVPVAIAYYEAQGFTCRFANRGYCEMFGRDEASVIGCTFAEVIGPGAATLIQPLVDRMLAEHRATSYEREIAGPDGVPRHIDVNLLPHLDAERRLVGAFVLIADITRHRHAEYALRQSEERLAKFMHASAEGIVFHKGGRITDVNPPLLTMLGYTLDEMMGRMTLDFIPPQERPRVAAVIASGAEIGYQSLATHKSGSEIPVEFIVRTMRHNDETLRMTVVRDMRDRLAAQERIHFLAHHDALTGLPNRYSFIERIEALVPKAVDRGERFALVFIDLDHFKRVNDSLGHLVGDALLRTVARRITSNLRSTDLVARFGGDEFVVLLADDAPPEAVHEVAHKLLQVVGEPVELEGRLISVTPSIGVSLFPEHGRTPDELIKHADTAMYDAKSRGRARFSVFAPAMAEAAYRALALEGQLAQALRDGEFVLHFQPQRSLADGALAGVEVLIRWRHPEQGLIEPDHFLPVAESRRLMVPIGHWVLEQALLQAARWAAAGLMQVPVAVNLSAEQCAEPDFAERIERALLETGLPPPMLELELTERTLMDEQPEVRAALHRLKRHGVRVAVDDFGTGYSSLGLLKDLPIDRLKIDRSFVKDLPHDGRAAAIASAIVQLGHGLGLEVLAEGVETDQQRDWLAGRGCNAMQGFLDARPMPAAEFEAWLQRG